ncbi:MAG: hypothetical protein LC620_00605 [Halobacteriales archaeon]|nr:hypothetical protein [Halobacteriales archaeon]
MASSILLLTLLAQPASALGDGDFEIMLDGFDGGAGVTVAQDSSGVAIGLCWWFSSTEETPPAGVAPYGGFGGVAYFPFVNTAPFIDYVTRQPAAQASNQTGAPSPPGVDAGNPLPFVNTEALIEFLIGHPLPQSGNQTGEPDNGPSAPDGDPGADPQLPDVDWLLQAPLPTVEFSPDAHTNAGTQHAGASSSCHDSII